MKEDDLKSLQLAMDDEEDGGWAGHHGEVDYTKEVVFDDSEDSDGDVKAVSRTTHAPAQSNKEKVIFI